MSYQKVKDYFQKEGIDNRIVIHNTVSDTVEHAALLIGCKPEEIAKTMSFLVNDTPIAIVMAGDVKVSNSKFKNHFNVKAKMVPFNDVENIIGHIPGGVCPFAVNENVKVYLDNSLKRFKFVYAAAGKPHATIGLSISELEKHSNYIEWIDVTEKKISIRLFNKNMIYY